MLINVLVLQLHWYRTILRILHIFLKHINDTDKMVNELMYLHWNDAMVSFIDGYPMTVACLGRSSKEHKCLNWLIIEHCYSSGRLSPINTACDIQTMVNLNLTKCFYVLSECKIFSGFQLLRNAGARRYFSALEFYYIHTPTFWSQYCREVVCTNFF